MQEYIDYLEELDHGVNTENANQVNLTVAIGHNLYRIANSLEELTKIVKAAEENM